MEQNLIQGRNALAGRTPLAAGGVSVTVAEEVARFVLRLAPEGLDQAGRCFGCALPARIGALSATDDRTALCLGPDEWFLMAPPDDAAGIAEAFAAELKQAHSLVDVGHREVGIEVRGPAATLALRAVCALDLDAMPAPGATRTILDKAQVVLIKHAPDRYRVEVWQSFASHVWGLLQAAAQDIALDL